MLPDLETRLYRLLSALDFRPTLEKSAEIGRLLRDARPHVPHGDWAAWLKRFRLSRSSAHDHIQVATILEAGDGNVRPAGQMGIKGFLAAWRSARRAAVKADRRAWVDGLPTAKTVPGLHCGDALKVMGRMADGSVDAVITDPPFGLGLDYDGWVEPAVPAKYWEWFTPYYGEMQRVVRPGGLVVVCQAEPHWRYLHQWFPEDAYLHVRTNIQRSQWYWTPVVVWRRPGADGRVRVGRGAVMAGAACDPAMLGMGTQHPCPMMYEFGKQLIQRYSVQGDVVLDPFAGTATLGAAARELGRGYIGIERSRRYFNLAKRRLAGLEKTTG